MARVLALAGLCVLASGCTPGFSLFGWGLNGSGQIGDGTLTNKTSTTRVETAGNWSAIAGGSTHSCGVRGGGVWCWGSNGAGQLGDGTLVAKSSPVRVGADNNWKAVSLGQAHSCALRGSGAMWCWGSNASGQLGDGSGSSHSEPVQVGTLAGWTRVSAGGAHTCALRSGGELWCWGSGTSGQLGDGSAGDKAQPFRIGSDLWSTVDAGVDGTCGVRIDGSGWCWGANGAGQLGVGSVAPQLTPAPLDGGGLWTRIDIAATHTCGLTVEGTAWCWGANGSGQLGTGNTTPSLVPVPVVNLGGWIDIATATIHSCGIRATGTMACWGSNSNGRLGDGTSTNRLQPTRIGRATDWTRLAGGWTHMLGLRTSISDVDTDGDGLPDHAETGTGVYVSPADTGTSPTNPDTDGDGINDGDEVLGTPGGLDLAALGANPLKKDILLEYDWFEDAIGCTSHTHRPSVAAINRLAAAFATAPVSNPDGTTGINIISDYGQGGPFTGGNHIHDADGVIAGGVNGSDFLGYKATNFAANRHGYFHYVLMPHRYDTTSSSSGQAEVLGDDLIVSLQCSNSTNNVSNTIMHELGHNLNLRHGGNVNTNHKPNYNSVMNYRYQFPGVDTDCTPPGNGRLDFSTGSRPSLNENALVEAHGICGAAAGVPWDWSGNGVIDAATVRVDINNADGLFGILHDHDDWQAVRFGGIHDSDGVGTQSVEIISEQPVPLEFQD